MDETIVLKPKEIITTLSNKKTGEKYKDVQRDVRVIMPPLDLFSKTK